jgi:hypothetical protein
MGTARTPSLPLGTARGGALALPLLQRNDELIDGYGFGSSEVCDFAC